MTQTLADRLADLLGDLRTAALPTKPDVVTLCGPNASYVADAVEAGLTALREREAMREQIREAVDGAQPLWSGDVARMREALERADAVMQHWSFACGALEPSEVTIVAIGTALWAAHEDARAALQGRGE